MMDPDPKGQSINYTDYRAIIEFLLYLTANIPDIITFTIRICARYQFNPKKSHMETAKRIHIYLKWRMNLRLRYTTDDNSELTVYSYADYGGVELTGS